MYVHLDKSPIHQQLANNTFDDHRNTDIETALLDMTFEFTSRTTTRKTTQDVDTHRTQLKQKSTEGCRQN